MRHFSKNTMLNLCWSRHTDVVDKPTISGLPQDYEGIEEDEAEFELSANDDTL